MNIKELFKLRTTNVEKKVMIILFGWPTPRNRNFSFIKCHFFFLSAAVSKFTWNQMEIWHGSIVINHLAVGESNFQASKLTISLFNLLWLVKRFTYILGLQLFIVSCVFWVEGQFQSVYVGTASPTAYLTSNDELLQLFQVLVERFLVFESEFFSDDVEITDWVDFSLNMNNFGFIESALRKIIN